MKVTKHRLILEEKSRLSVTSLKRCVLISAQTGVCVCVCVCVFDKVILAEADQGLSRQQNFIACFSAAFHRQRP